MRIELNAVERRNATVNQRQIAQMQVAVAFTNKAIGLARLDHGFLDLELPLTPAFQMIQLFPTIRIHRGRPDVRKILHNPVMYIARQSVLMHLLLQRLPGHAWRRPARQFHRCGPG